MFEWKPVPGSPQEDFLSSQEEEILFGGAAGGMKTESIIVDPLRDIGYSDYKAILFRRTFPNMMEIQDRCRIIYPQLGGEYRAGEHRWYFPSGATIALGHMADEDSYYNYLSFEFQYIGFDEAGQFLPKQLSYLFSRLRSTNPNIRRRMRYCTNPGGPAHQYLKDRFRIAQYPQGGITWTDRISIKNPNTGEMVEQAIRRRFIPSKVWDNPYIMEKDPSYIAALYQLSETERMRLLEGRWDAFEGQFFAEINEEVHGYEGDIPHDWEAIAAHDWGYARPWVYAIFRVDYDGRLWLDHLHYGAKQGMTNVGVRQTNGEIARTIRDIEQAYPVKVRLRVAGPDLWSPKKNRDGILGPPPAEDYAREGIIMVKADNNRLQGWQQIHQRLYADPENPEVEPMLKVRKSLAHWWRTMTNLQADPKNPEDISLRDIEDHIPETTRYACMARPIRPHVVTAPDTGSFQAIRRKLIAARSQAARYGTSLDSAYKRAG